MSKLNPVEVIFKLVIVLKQKMSHRSGCVDIGDCLSPLHIQVLKHVGTKKEITANQIAIDLMRDKAQVTRLLNTLMKEGLIQKKVNPTDKRSQLIVCTNTGEALFQQAIDIDQYILDKLREGLSDKELLEFQRLAEKMMLNLERLKE